SPCAHPVGHSFARPLLAAPLLRLLRLALLELLDVLFGVVLEGVPAAGAADVIGLALVHHRDGAEAAADDALRLTVRTGERHALLGAADLIQLGEQRLVLRL